MDRVVSIHAPTRGATQFIKKVNELIRENNKMIKDRAEKVLKAGCIELSDYEDNYILPKIFMYAIGEEMKFQWKPFSGNDLKTAKNIIYFL